MILSSLKSGIANTWQTKRIAVLFYFTNFLFGLVLMTPIYALLNRFAGESLMMEKLAGKMDMDFLFEFFIKNQSGFSSMRWLLIIVPSLYWLFGLFLSGGAFSIFISGENYSSSTFWSGSAKYFGRFLRLTIWCIPIFAIFYCIQFIEPGIQRIIYGKDPYQNITYWGGLIQGGLGYVGILLFYLVFDYARIYAVSTDDHKMRRALWHGIKFTFRNFFRTFSITLILFLIGIAVLFIYNPIADSLHAPNTFIILILLIVQQIYMFFRMMLKLTLYSSQVSLYNTLTPQEEIAESPIEIA